MNKMWTSNQRLYKRADGSITTNRNEAQSLYVGVGGQIPEEEAISLGLLSRPAIQTETLLDTDALVPEAKAQEEPQENKAIEAPAENKSIEKPKRGRRKKVA